MKKNIILTYIFIVIVLIILFYYFQFKRTKVIPTIAPVVTNTTTPIATPTTDHDGMKLYQNKEFGFEFWYPNDWEVLENDFRGPSSKFNLVVHPINTHPNFEPLLVNITTKEFVDGEYADIKKDAMSVLIDNVKSSKYQYVGDTSYIDIIIPVNNDTDIIIGNANKEHVLEFNKIVSTFKFIK